MKKLASLIFFLLLAASLLFGCGKEAPTADDAMSQLLAAVGSLPAGTLFRSSATPYGADACLDGELVASLFARDDGYCEYDSGVESAAVYLGAHDGSYCEVGVFVCYGSADTEAVATMCLRRARLVCRGLYLPAEQVCIGTRGRVVILCIASDTELASRLFAAVE